MEIIYLITEKLKEYFMSIETWLTTQTLRSRLGFIRNYKIIKLILTNER